MITARLIYSSRCIETTQKVRDTLSYADSSAYVTYEHPLVYAWLSSVSSMLMYAPFVCMHQHQLKTYSPDAMQSSEHPLEGHFSGSESPPGQLKLLLPPVCSTNTCLVLCIRLDPANGPAYVLPPKIA